MVDYTDPDGGGRSGSVTLVVGKPLAVAEQPENKSLWVGVPITVTGVVGAPLVSSSNFALSPVEDSTYGTMTPGTELSEDALTRTACKGVPLLESALADAGMLSDSISGIELSSDLKKTHGCVVFSYEKSDRPTTVSYHAYGLDEAGASIPSWNIAVPSFTRRPPLESSTA